MAHVPCRVCGNPVNADAVECPHCGAADPAPADGPTDLDAGERVKRTTKGIGCVAMSILALILAILVAILAWIF